MHRRVKPYQVIFGLIFFLAAFLRLYKLGIIPAGLNWDEASIAYNAYGIITVHRDEWLSVLPLAFKSFGEYKEPVAIYAVAILIKLFGMSSFIFRLPMALAGIVTVAASYWLGLYLFRRQEPALFLMALLAASPLSVHYSRIGFESTIAVACIVLGTVFFLYAPKWKWMYVASGLSFVLALYANHSTKIFLPLYLLVLAITFRKTILQHRKIMAISLAIAVLTLLPLAYQFLRGQGHERLFMTSSIVSEDGKVQPLSDIVSDVFENYISHFDLNFLLFGKMNTYQDGNGVFGVLSYLEFFFAIIGIAGIIARKAWRKEYGWVLLLIFFAIIPAAISRPAPHSNRIIHIIPWVQVLAVLGYVYLQDHLRKVGQDSVRWMVIIIFGLQLVWYSWSYLTVYQYAAPADFQYGYQQVISYTQTQENNVDTVLFTPAYDQPYIYLLLYKRIDPIAYHQGGLNRYKIQPLQWDNLWMRKNVLIVGTPEEIPFYVPNIVHEVLFPDGTVAFRVVKL